MFRTLRSNDCSQVTQGCRKCQCWQGKREDQRSEFKRSDCLMYFRVMNSQNAVCFSEGPDEKLISVWFSSTDGSAIRTGFPSVVNSEKNKSRNESRSLCVVIINIDTESLKSTIHTIFMSKFPRSAFGGAA